MLEAKAGYWFDTGTVSFTIIAFCLGNELFGLMIFTSYVPAQLYFSVSGGPSQIAALSNRVDHFY